MASNRKTATVLRLVPRATPCHFDVDRDTEEVLKNLLDMARKGELRGVAVAALLRDRRYFVDASGEAHRNPTFARGMVAALDDELAGRVHGA